MIDDEIRRLRAQGMGMLDVAKKLGVPLARVADVSKQKPVPTATPFADTSQTILLQQMAEEITRLRMELGALAGLKDELSALRDRVDVLKALLDESNTHNFTPGWSDWMSAKELAPILGVDARRVRTALRGRGAAIVAGKMVESKRGLSNRERLYHEPRTQILYRYKVRP